MDEDWGLAEGVTRGVTRYAGRGRGRGFFRGNFGWGMGQIDAPPFATKEAVAQRKTWLENQLAAVSKQLQDLDKE